MKRTHREACGCLASVGEREAWLELCPKHKAEHDELHARAAREHRAGTLREMSEAEAARYIATSHYQ